jgi:hypothetical protein
MARVRGEMEDAYVQQCRDHNDDDHEHNQAEQQVGNHNDPREPA